MTAAVPSTGSVPVASAPRAGRAVSWWGMLLVISTEGMIFLVLLAAWFFLRASATSWPPKGYELPDLTLTIPFSFVLWGSSLPMFYAEACLRRGRIGGFRVGMALAWLMGLAFLAYSAHDFAGLHYGWRDSAYASAFYVIVGLHTIHVVVGMVMSAVIQVKAAAGRFDRGVHGSAVAVALYWHFVDAVWLFVMPSLFIGTHIR